MLTVAISLVRDEADIAPYTFGHLVEQVDHVIVADNGSRDGTGDILRGLGVEVIDDPEIGYRQSEKMTALAHRARKAGADWILPVDGDELWLTTDGRTIWDVLVESTADIIEAPLYNHIATGADPDDPDPVRRMQWRLPDPAPLPKVACRAREGLQITQGNHSAHYPYTWRSQQGPLAVHHYSHRSPEQMVRKVRNGAEAYAATDLPESMGAHWRQWGELLDREGPEAIEDLYRRWWWRADPEAEIVIEGERQSPLIFDPAQQPKETP